MTEERYLTLLQEGYDRHEEVLFSFSVFSQSHPWVIFQAGHLVLIDEYDWREKIGFYKNLPVAKSQRKKNKKHITILHFWRKGRCRGLLHKAVKNIQNKKNNNKHI